MEILLKAGHSCRYLIKKKKKERRQGGSPTAFGFIIVIAMTEQFDQTDLG